MRLSSIKLSGFKSFIDPENLHLTKNLCVIVGPNGCGKSNIVDAIRWVLGEVSARHLRGEAMADVIFSGSETRPPASRAFVELIFDNSDGRIQHKFASYAEISVARQLTSDGVSRYYLNGQSCRRRDVTDVFAGTGLGPRGYSVVEQGMIANLVEATPEALRMQLEEAAGISKYKERRRETETRMRHTRENMQRITDINQETSRQAAHLKQQAEVATKFRKLQDELSLVQGKRLYLQWRELSGGQEQFARRIREQDNLLTAATTENQKLQLEGSAKQTELDECTLAVSEAQASNYELLSAITSHESEIRSQEQRLGQLKETLAENQTRQEQIHKQLGEDDGKTADLQELLTAAANSLQEATDEVQTTKQTLEAAELAMNDWQAGWEALQLKHNAALKRQAEKAALLKQAEAIMEHIKPQIASLTAESEPAEQKQYEQQSEEFSKQIATLDSELGEQTSVSVTSETELRELQQKLQATANKLHELRLGLEKMLGEKASSELWLAKATGTTDENAKAWLAKTGLDKASSLSHDLAVPTKWQAAVELVLGDLLGGLVIDDTADVETLAAKLNTGKDGRITLIDGSQGELPTSDSDVELPTLADQLSHSHPAAKLLGSVYVATSKKIALDNRRQLATHESIITADCFWVSPLWVRAQDAPAADGSEHQGVLESTARLAALNKAITEQGTEIKQTEKELADNNKNSEAWQRKLDECKEVLLALRESKTDIEAKQRAFELQNKESAERKDKARESLAILSAEHAEKAELFSKTTSELKTTEKEIGELDAEKSKLVKERDKLAKDLHKSRDQQDVVQRQRHKRELAHQGYAIESDNLQAEKQSLTTQYEELVANQGTLSAEMNTIHPNIDNLQKELQQNLDAHAKQKKALEKLQKKDEALRDKLQKISTNKNATTEKIDELRGVLEELRLEHKGYETQQKNFEQQLAAAGHTKDELSKQIDEQDTEELLARKASSLESRLQRLGAINMAATEEYEAISEKQQYLEQQHQDLATALKTLEDAIARIDQETMTRFKQVCADVNINLGKYFATFFGGGAAKLEMTSDDLLETGLIVMARPPGKKNNSIKLLSGGEKALTALALVFALFELNPAPLCVLDEVDAALDDANLLRYAQALREMSEQIQFVCVTHNKTSIETAGQLVGVTMKESGVSRLIAVNLEEATAAIAGR